MIKEFPAKIESIPQIIDFIDSIAKKLINNIVIAFDFLLLPTEATKKGFAFIDFKVFSLWR